jgi:uncharacterized protein
MAIDPNIIKQVNDFISFLEFNNLHIENAYIFGSHIRGTATKYSDIDLALVSKSFSGIRIEDNTKIIKNTPHTFIDIETHPFRPEDFSPENPLANEIIKTGYKVI